MTEYVKVKICVKDKFTCEEKCPYLENFGHGKLDFCLLWHEFVEQIDGGWKRLKKCIDSDSGDNE